MNCKHCGKVMKKVRKQRDGSRWGAWVCKGYEQIRPHMRVKMNHKFYFVPLMLLGFDNLEYQGWDGK